MSENILVNIRGKNIIGLNPYWSREHTHPFLRNSKGVIVVVVVFLLDSNLLMDEYSKNICEKIYIKTK